MNNTAKALVWAALILVVALTLKANDVGTIASAGIIFGLSAAAWGAISSKSSTCKGCVI
jgi:uncharacterized membrane protein